MTKEEKQRFDAFVADKMPGCDVAQRLIAEKAWCAALTAPQATLASLQQLDFKLRADGGEGLPAEACALIDGALA